ncbi:hypothetical protein SGM_4309 [Streptomyces griseoaurantiacus M045]|uniref:Uncharacterized protein n=1 Tax=Streptomyces griseoaurantiacus M045 TaxID=996637 RepID=F3NM54_9ACTN|nr:hypothetical protein SGM_4309 [Streptomyces griseoaurantiacus M045]
MPLMPSHAAACGTVSAGFGYLLAARLVLHTARRYSGN